MSPYPAQYSVLILDNVSIHKSQYLRDLCEEKGIGNTKRCGVPWR